jgi:hypothetical protein
MVVYFFEFGELRLGNSSSLNALALFAVPNGLGLNHAAWGLTFGGGGGS